MGYRSGTGKTKTLRGIPYVCFQTFISSVGRTINKSACYFCKFSRRRL